MTVRMDLNADVGESFGTWVLGDDEAMLEVVTSANVACGFHAGDPTTIRRTVARAADRGVVVGAQVGYRDLAGFGRRRIDMRAADLTADVLYQLGALEAMCRVAGTRVAYVKPHGALYTTAAVDEGQARAVVEAVLEYDPALPLLCQPGLPPRRTARATVARRCARHRRRCRREPGPAHRHRGHRRRGRRVARGPAGAVRVHPWGHSWRGRAGGAGAHPAGGGRHHGAPLRHDRTARTARTDRHDPPLGDAARGPLARHPRRRPARR